MRFSVKAETGKKAGKLEIHGEVCSNKTNSIGLGCLQPRTLVVLEAE